jgi:hypothetical protein
MKIVIAGGGTAGWLAALFFIRNFKNTHNITVIESSKIGSIGVGEGSTGLFLDLLENRIFDTGLDINQFFTECDATFKLGIHHQNWGAKLDSYYAPLNGSPTSLSSPDYLLMHTKLNYGKSKMHLASNLGTLIENNKIGNGALHFNAIKLGIFLKKFCIDQGVNYIDDEIFGVKTNTPDNIQSLICNSGQEIYGDFFLDCTGFKRCLMGAIDVPWISYKKHLPVNCAIPFQLPHETEEIKPVTVAKAMNHGWMWEIPTQSRIGKGYIFSDDFLTPDEAIEEIENTLNRKIDPIKLIRFEAGRSEVSWKGNCVAIGLSSAFLEPLEATSIHSTIVQLVHLTFNHIKSTKEDTVNSINMTNFNKKICNMYDDFRDFIIVHYKGGRVDTDFWRYMQSSENLTDNVTNILSFSKNQLLTPLMLDNYYGCVGSSLYNWILLGLDLVKDDVLDNHLKIYQQDNINDVYNYYQQQWDAKEKMLPSHLAFLKSLRVP